MRLRIKYWLYRRWWYWRWLRRASEPMWFIALEDNDECV